MSTEQPILPPDQQQYVFQTKADVLASLIKCQAPEKGEAEKLAEMVNAAFAKLTS